MRDVVATQNMPTTVQVSLQLKPIALSSNQTFCSYVVLLHLWVFYVLSHHQPARGLNDRPCPPGGK